LGFGFSLFILSCLSRVSLLYQFISLVLDDKKNHKKILDEIGLQDLSLTSRITPIAIMVWKLQKSQDDTNVLPRI